MRFHFTQRWKRKIADAPPEIRQTVSHALAMLDEGRWVLPGVDPSPDEPTAILRTSEAHLGRSGELIAALGDVLIRFFRPTEYPDWIILEDLLWH